MTANPLLIPLLIGAVGALAVGGIVLVRAQDQRYRDARRVTVELRFPRGLTKEQVTALVRAVVGLARARSGLGGQDSVAFEVVGNRRGISHRLRLPAASSAYITAQLRGAVPGIGVKELEDDATLPPGTKAVELRRRLTASDLNLADVAAVSRTILAATTHLSRDETVVWQVIVAGGISQRPTEFSWRAALSGQPASTGSKRRDVGVTTVALRAAATATGDKRSAELVSRLRRAASSVAAPGARLVARLLPTAVVARRVQLASTPIAAAPAPLTVDELTALLGWPIDSPLVEGLTLGGSPQLPVPTTVPSNGRILGRASVGGRRVAQPVRAAAEHSLILGPTGSGKSWLTIRMFLDDVAAGRGALVLDPKGGAAQAIIERLPEEAIARTVLVDPTDSERPVPLPLLAVEEGGIPELAADTLVGLLRHRYRDLGPRSTDVLSSSLYALARVPGSTLMDLLPLWGDARFRARVARLVKDDPVLVQFFAWFEGLGVAERNFILAAPLNKIRPLLQRSVVRNVLAAPRATFSIAQALRERLVVIVVLPEGVLGSEATTLLGQVVLARLWAATQARRSRAPYYVTIDEAPRFLDLPTDLGDVLARSREYAVALSIVGQTLSQFPQDLREIALNSARTKVAFGTSATDARRLAAEFGPAVQPDYFAGLARYEAIGAVSLGGTVSAPFTFTTEALEDPIRGRAAQVRAASRSRWGLPRAEIEAALNSPRDDDSAAGGPVGRRAK